MSGGFFRGTSADQDTRFSNKQAKLMKTQKFAPELEHLVDVSKVKMDVVKPWIANRVTEILGFEDEVLINFIYGLLDGKVVNGKEVQIQITGFMEKNTGKFMKELWNLLLSAQKNASGVPQQFLDAKEEEIRKKKVETDRITQEIQRKKELEHEKQKKMDDEAAILKAVDDASKPVRKHSSAQSEDDKGSGERNGVRGKNRSSRSPHSVERSPSPDRIPRSRSMSRSFSNSRSYSDDRHKSRSMSRSPQPRGRSISSDRQYRSPRKRTLSPRRKYSPRRPRSPIRRRSPYSRRRPSPYSYRRSPSPGSGSPSPVLRGSPSLRRRRPPTPVRRRSPSPVRRRRSPSPVRRRRSPSPVRRRRSPSPVRRRRSPSPMRRRSPPPMRRRSPLRRRSPPPRRRSPIATRRRSPSPSRYPSPPRRNSPSPLRRSPTSPRQRRRSPFRPARQTYRSGSPHRSRSPAHRRRRSPSRDDDIRTNGMGSRRYRDDYVSERTHGRKSPVQGLDPVTRQPPISLRSPQRDSEDGSDAHRKMPISRVLSPSQSGSSLHTGKSSPSEDRSQSEGPASNTREQVTRADSASPVRQTRHSISEEGTRYSRRVDAGQRTESPQRRTKHSGEAEHSTVDIEMRRRDRDKKSKQASTRTDLSLSPTKSPHMIEAVEHNPGRVDIDNSLPNNTHVEQPSAKQQVSPSPKRLHTSYSREDHKVDEKHSSGRNVVDSGLDEETEHLRKSMKRVHSNSTNRTATLESDSEDEKNKSNNMERKKHKRKDRHHMASDDDTSYDSHIDERKEAKRRKKEEKKLRKEEKRRRREEKRRRKEQRHAGKLKAKTMDTSTPPSDVDKKRSDADDSDDHVAARIDFHPSDTEETESEQKRLEIQLRKKALESLRAKKAINP